MLLVRPSGLTVVADVAIVAFDVNLGALYCVRIAAVKGVFRTDR